MSRWKSKPFINGKFANQTQNWDENH